MEELKDNLTELRVEFRRAQDSIGFEALDRQERELHQQMVQPDFWNDSQAAQGVSQQQAKLERRLQPWRELQQGISDLYELIDLDDGTLGSDLNLQLDDLVVSFARLKE